MENDQSQHRTGHYKNKEERERERKINKKKQSHFKTKKHAACDECDVDHTDRDTWNVRDERDTSGEGKGGARLKRSGVSVMTTKVVKRTCFPCDIVSEYVT